jgi:tRNA (pseudouridine54-N1)-methyltransferase
MRTFVLRARAAPTDSQKLLAGVGQEAHTEILAHTLMNAIFVAQSHRADVMVYLVLESTQDFSRAIRFDANAMREIGGFDERALLGKVAKALDASRGMGNEETRPVESGVTVRNVAFERLGAQKITLGSKMLCASQCVVLIHHELDQR